MSSRLDRIWAPWRGEWIKSQKENHKKNVKPACPFCKAFKEKPSSENLVLYKSKNAMVILNKFPYNPGHLMVIPGKHGGDFAKLPAKVAAEVTMLLQLSMKLVEKAYEPQGFNMGMNLGAAGGAGIPGHLHWHMVPRWNGDTNFMPLLAETKAVSTHNLTIYEKLSPYFAKIKL